MGGFLFTKEGTVPKATVSKQCVCNLAGEKLEFLSFIFYFMCKLAMSPLLRK